MHKALVGRVTDGLKQLTDMGLKWEGAGIFWWQGESDTWFQKGADNYAELFDDLINGVDVKTKDGKKHITGIRELLKNPKTPVVLARLSKNLTGGPSKVIKDIPARLQIIRKTQMDFVERDAHAAWVNVDDQKQKDGAHFVGQAYVTIYTRFAETYLSLLKAEDSDSAGG